MNAKHGLRLLGAITLLTLSAGVSGQATPTSFKHSCLSVGMSPPEPLADRAGQSISIGDYVCTTEGGPLDGATVNGRSMTHFEGPKGTALSASGVTRKPGAQAVWVNSEGRTELKMSEGRVTGFEGTGRGRYVLGSGAFSALNGKGYSYKAYSTGPGRFAIDVSME